jgi:serine/threonine protein phosphatase PrpC
MTSSLQVTTGHYSHAGRKAANQDFHGLCIPPEPLLASKGVAVVLADGISSSEVGQVASESAVKSFLTDYYCTSQAWSVKRSALQVLQATNGWLHAQTQRGQGRLDKNRGYVCTLSALVLRSTTAHVFHVGDTRIHRIQHGTLEPLTTDHRLVLSEEESYLSRAMGVSPQLEIDHLSVPLSEGDLFLLTTDGVHEYVDAPAMLDILQRHAPDWDQAASAMAQAALQQGSPDNVSVQIVRVEALPTPQASELPQQALSLPLASLPDVGQSLDGYRIVRVLHASHRSHVFLAHDDAHGQALVIKMPSVDMAEDARALERLWMEEWVARRIHNPHVLKPYAHARPRSSLYVALEYVAGQTLAQWMADHPPMSLAQVRSVAEQIARGLQAFHRLEMVHQDLRPQNVLLDAEGTIKIIDLGATRVASVTEDLPPDAAREMLGTLQYSAPEYLLGEGSSSQSDLFSLGVMVYQMLSGQWPYGASAARIRRPADVRRLQYQSLRSLDASIPAWVDDAIRKAVDPDPRQRYEAVSEFIWDLSHPNASLASRRTPLIERDPVRFWKGVSLLLWVTLLASWWWLSRMH